MQDVENALNEIEAGDANAASRLLTLVYDQLRQLAARKLADERPGQTLEATALVHEVYLRLVGQSSKREWKSRAHFFAAAAEAMRRILVDNARRKHAKKRGGDRQQQELYDIAAPVGDDELLALDEALHKLAKVDPLKAQLVELRYYAGLTSEQAAEILTIAPATADRYWAYARAWLRAEVRGED
jgi:RNA polymerase sigma factor (TIGR02999 family)